MRYLAVLPLTLLCCQVRSVEPVGMPSTVAKDAQLVEVYAAKSFFEGPTWDPATKRLYFTSFPGGRKSRILRLEAPGKVTVWADDTQGVNGTFFSYESRLLGAQAFGHRIIDYAFGADGPADAKILLHDDTLHQPNDVCQAPGGDVYFTDPDFTHRKTSAVYLLRGTKATKIITDMPLPNGLITSLDGKVLYVGDSHQRHWRCYPIKPDGTVGDGKLFFNPDTQDRSEPDGMSIDEHGNLYFSGRGGVWVVNPQGKALGLIAVPVFCSNCGFGGEDGKTLYLTCSEKVYALAMSVRGGQFVRPIAVAQKP